MENEPIERVMKQIYEAAKRIVALDPSDPHMTLLEAEIQGKAIDDMEKAIVQLRARLRERVSTQEDGLSFGEQVCARLVVERDEARRNARAWADERESVRRERDEARHSCRMLRQYLVEVMPWVGVCPLDPDAIHDMALARDLASDALAERPTWSTTPSTGGSRRDLSSDALAETKK